MGNAAICGERFVKIRREDGKTLKLLPSPNLNAKSVLAEYPGYSIFDTCSERELSGGEILECGHLYVLIRCTSQNDLYAKVKDQRKTYISFGAKRDSLATAGSAFSADGAALRVKIRLTRSELEALISDEANADQVLAALQLSQPRPRQMRWRPRLDSISELVSPRPGA